MKWRDTAVLVTGGTGSFGRALVEMMLAEHHPRRLIVFSRDETKQEEMRRAGIDHPRLHYVIGDVRDADRLRRAMRGTDVVIHAAALKQVPACEANPIEAVLTNVMGARNVIEAALDAGVARVVGVSTDKAVNPVSLYGATKLLAEKLFVDANAAGRSTRFACVRFGNFVGSRGSVIPLLLEQRRRGAVTITDRRMTRFWVTFDESVRVALRCAEEMAGGEIYVPKLPSMKLVDLVEAIAPGCPVEVIGIRPGEKLHEVLVSEDEARRTVETRDLYVIEPAQAWWQPPRRGQARRVKEGFRFTSETNSRWLTPDDLRRLVLPTTTRPKRRAAARR
jgi:UDP-N-acetylglucosamine 4,6-dehydratase